MSTIPQHAPTQSAKDPLEPTISSRAHGNTVAFLCSLVFHTALLLILACWVYTAGKKSQGLLINARVDQSDGLDIAELDSFELSMNEVASPKFEEVEQDFKFETNIESLTVAEADPVGESPEPSSEGTKLTSVSVEGVIDQLSEPEKKRRGANFFGAYAQGNEFIYIVDSSSSMTGDRWLYAWQQLIDSLKGLKPGQKFYVICFDHETTFLFGQNPQTARYYEPTEQNIGRVKNWLRHQQLGDQTRPAQALQYALNFRPDAIFLLSDGELGDRSRSMLHRINSNVSTRPQVPIHTIHLFSMQGRETLRMIAKENNGSFTPIQNGQEFNRLDPRRRRRL